MTRPVLLPVGREPLRHGYRVDDVHRLAVRAAASRFVPRTLPHDERVDAAWYAIVEHLYVAADCPSPTHLGYVGQQAITEASRLADRHAGVNRVSRRPMPRWVTYWTQWPTPSHEDGVVERLALLQVLALLPAAQREALVALAMVGDRAGAARALGLTDGGLDSRLQRARAVVYAAWFEGQTPPVRRRDRRVGSYGQREAA